MQWTKYEIPRTGIFMQDNNIYSPINGWGYIEVTETIIGEDEHLYIYRWLTTDWGEWVNDQVITTWHHIPLGYHKSRLIKWVPTQIIMELQ